MSMQPKYDGLIEILKVIAVVALVAWGILGYLVVMKMLLKYLFT